MQSIISLEVATSLAENGFSLDELVITANKLFSDKGIAGLLGLLLRVIDEYITMNIRQKVTTVRLLSEQ